MSQATGSLGPRTLDFVVASYYDESGTLVDVIRDNIFQSVTGSAAFQTFDNKASYLVLAATTSLSSERVLTAGTNITFTDAGAGSTLTINAASGGGTLDQAYDSGGAGAGAIITVDKQAVQLQTTMQSTEALVLTGALIVGSGSGLGALPGKDVLVWMKGTIGSQGTSTRGTALFDGDITTSGSFSYASSSVGYINIPAAGFMNASSMTFTPLYGNTGTSGSNWNNPGTVQGSLQAAIYGLPPGCTLDQIELHQSRSATQAGQVALFRFQDNVTTSNNHEHIASKTYTQKGATVITTLDNLSHSVPLNSTANQFAYHLVVISGQSVAPPGAVHRTYSARVRYYYSKMLL